MIPVDMSWSREDGWVLHTPVKLTPLALNEALGKAYTFHVQIWNDLPDGPAREELEEALGDLRNQRARQDVDGSTLREIVKTQEETPNGLLLPQ